MFMLLLLFCRIGIFKFGSRSSENLISMLNLKMRHNCGDLRRQIYSMLAQFQSAKIREFHSNSEDAT